MLVSRVALPCNQQTVQLIRIVTQAGGRRKVPRRRQRANHQEAQEDQEEELGRLHR